MEEGFVPKERQQGGGNYWELATWLSLAFMHVLKEIDMKIDFLNLELKENLLAHA